MNATVQMDEVISPVEVQRCWELGYDARNPEECPFDDDGDGFRWAAWQQGYIDRNDILQGR